MTIRRLAVAIVACALAFAFAFARSASAGELAGRVVEVSAGDSLTLLDADKQRHIVRLADIDAPEKAQRFAARSRQSLAELCAGKMAQVEDRGLDADGRKLGWVTCAGINANGEQVRRGMAWVSAQTVRQTSALYTLEARCAPGQARVVAGSAARRAMGMARERSLPKLNLARAEEKCPSHPPDSRVRYEIRRMGTADTLEGRYGIVVAKSHLLPHRRRRQGVAFNRSGAAVRLSPDSSDRRQWRSPGRDPGVPAACPG